MALGSALLSQATVDSSTTVSSILLRTLRPRPIAVSAKGVEIILQDGRKIVDGVGGAAVTAIGMGHPAVIKAVQEQVAKAAYVYNLQLSNEPAEELAKYLIDVSNGAFHRVGFMSGGTEAMESAIKLARQYFVEIKQPQRINFIGRKLSYHGSSLSTLALGNHPKRRLPYEAIINSTTFHHVSPAYALRYKNEGESDEDYVQRLADELDAKFQELGPSTVIGFVAEAVVGTTIGVGVAPKGYFKAMKSVCQKHGALFILDEVMCGMGRMGTLHGWESFGDGASPDIQAVAKGLGGGYAPMGAVLMNKRVADGITESGSAWKHGHTYQAHPVSCAAALAVQKVIRDENLLENARKRGEQLSSILRDRLASPNALSLPYIAEIRGGGVFWGIEFEVDNRAQAKLGKGVHFGDTLQEIAFKNGLNVIGMSGGVDGEKGDHAILAPPLNVTECEIEVIADLFVRSVEEAVAQLD